jgi:asparagine synthase (glutamine-hydrolysing)
MGGISGWVNSELGDGEALALVNAMAARMKFDPASAARSLHDTAAGLQATGENAGMHSSPQIWTACRGRMRWHTEELQETARRRGDAAALAIAYQAHGEQALDHLEGPFALAIIDRPVNRVLLAIDRLGTQPMYYALAGKQFVFASTADSLIAHPAIRADIAPQAIFNYLYFHTMPSPGTIYHKVEKLLPGQCVSFDGATLHKKFYWHLDYREDKQKSFSALAAEFRQHLRTGVRDSVDDTATTGAFLSGGTDSSTVSGVLRELAGRPVHTFSIGFDAAGFDETDYARNSARHFGTEHRTHYVTPEDLADAIPVISKAYDEPFGNASAIAAYCCARMAKAEGITVLLAGDGGDELFAGNARYAKQRVFEAYQAIPAPMRRRLIEPLIGLPRLGSAFPLSKLRSYVQQAGIPLPDRLETYNFLHRTPLEEIFTTDFLEQVDTGAPLESLREVYHRSRADACLNKMLYLDLKITLADNDLRKVVRTCEMAGVEARFPLLHESLVEFSARVPADLKLRRLNLRYFFKKALKDFLPEATIRKSKHGFGLPFGLWIKTHAALNELVQESLISLGRRGYLRPSYIDFLRQQHQSEHATYYGVMLWVLMMLEQWFQARAR